MKTRHRTPSLLSALVVCGSCLWLASGCEEQKPSQTYPCGDGVIEQHEQCDDGEENSLEPNQCRPSCTLPICGDGIVDDEYGETCDDGNDNVNDGCPSGPGELCQTAICGDGYVWNEDGGDEVCDDGNSILTDGCPDGPEGTCREATCGDGFKWVGIEQCDCGTDPENVPQDQEVCINYGINSDAAPSACRTHCEMSECGDGILDPSRGEQCDEGLANAQLPNACRTTCTLPICGDGIRDDASPYNEECDDGNEEAGDGCAPDCTIE
jgi:cysteine-rich repeat protein